MSGNLYSVVSSPLGNSKIILPLMESPNFFVTEKDVRNQIALEQEALNKEYQPVLDYIENYKKSHKVLCKEFNAETSEGKNMGKYSELLEQAISSIINVKDESDFESLFSSGESSYLKNTISGLDDFELICFLVVKE